MASVAVQTAGAIVDALNDGTWCLEFKAQRSYFDWDIELKEDGILHVDVVIASMQPALETRGQITYTCEIDVGIRKKIESSDQDPKGDFIPPTELDPLVELMEEFIEYFAADRLPDYTDAVWSVSDVTTPFAPGLLRKFQQWVGVLRITFESTKDLS